MSNSRLQGSTKIIKIYKTDYAATVDVVKEYHKETLLSWFINHCDVADIQGTLYFFLVLFQGVL